MQCAVEGKGDHILAARFLSRFVPKETPWAHMDLSSATRSGGLAHIATEVTGFGVRFALELLLRQRPPRRAASEPSHDEPHAHAARRLAPAPARWRRAGRRTALHRRALRARHRHAQSQAAGHDDGRSALAYRERIRAALPAGARFEPLMTLYLTDHTAPREIDRGARQRLRAGCKLYPAGATTHSEAGVTDLRDIDPVLEHMSERGMVLQVHGEVTDPQRGRVRSRGALHRAGAARRCCERHPRLRIVFEHITTRAAVEFVRARARRHGRNRSRRSTCC